MCSLTRSNVNFHSASPSTTILDISQVKSSIPGIVDKTPHPIRLLSKRAPTLKDPRLVARRMGGNMNFHLTGACIGILDVYQVSGTGRRIRSQKPEPTAFLGKRRWGLQDELAVARRSRCNVDFYLATARIPGLNIDEIQNAIAIVVVERPDTVILIMKHGRNFHCSLRVFGSTGRNMYLDFP